MRLALLLAAALPLAHASAQARAPAPARAGAIPYRMVRSPVSGAVLPRISLRTPRARAVNAQLDTLAAGLRCDPEAVRRGRTEPYQSESRVTYAANDVFSVFVLASWYCGGAYPVDGAELSVTYDLRTGRAVLFAELWADYTRDGPRIIRAIFPEQAAAAARPQHDPPDAEHQCDGISTMRELMMRVDAYTLSPRGLAANLDFPHAMRPCGDRMTVPFARVLRWAAPNGILARVARARAR